MSTAHGPKSCGARFLSIGIQFRFFHPLQYGVSGDDWQEMVVSRITQFDISAHCHASAATRQYAQVPIQAEIVTNQFECGIDSNIRSENAPLLIALKSGQ